MTDKDVTVDIAMKCLIAGMCDRNPEEWHHCRRVERMCGQIAKELDWSSQQVADLRLAALLHHLDRSHVPESALTRSVAAYLHRFEERVEKASPPDQRTQTHEDEGADIIAVADTFDRLVSTQRYRRAVSEDDAIKVLRFDSGAAFSASVVDAFCRICDVGLDLPERKAA